MLHHGEPPVPVPSRTTLALVLAALMAFSSWSGLGTAIVVVLLPSLAVVLNLTVLSLGLVLRYLTSPLLASARNWFQVTVGLLPELSMIIFWAKNASTTTTMMGNAALLKNLLTGWFAYLPAGVAERYHGGFPLYWRPRALRYTKYATRPAAVSAPAEVYRQPPWAT